jgi:hypothetical protein
LCCLKDEAVALGGDVWCDEVNVKCAWPCDGVAAA